MNNDIKEEIFKNIFSAKVIKNEKYDELVDLLEEMYLELNKTLNVSGLMNNMNEILYEIREIINFDFLNFKNIIAVGGGFSSGKSSFLNQLIKDVKLPVDINPSTAIPTYIFNSEEKFSKIYAINGGVNKVDLSFHKNLNHETLSKIDFNITSIMPYITLGTKIYTNRFKNVDISNICFIDTPGYNAGNVGTSEMDKKLAIKHIENAKSLIWLVALDVNGTLSVDDLKILRMAKDKNPEIKIYILLSKADLIYSENLEDILEEVNDKLYDESIEVEGIEAVSSYTDIEYIYYNKRLYEFLEEENKLGNKLESIILKINSKFYDYISNLEYESRIKISESIDNVLCELDNVMDRSIQKDVRSLAIYLNDKKKECDEDFRNIGVFIDKIQSYYVQIINKIKNIFEEIADKTTDQNIRTYINSCIQEVDNDN